MASTEPAEAIAADSDQPAHRKITNIQALRAVAIILVIFRHVLVFQWGSQQATGGWRDLFLVGEAGVDVFFVISGFVMVEATRTMFRRHHAPREFLLRRLTRIYPPFWFYSGLLLGVYLVKPELIHRIALGGEVDILSSFLLIPTHSAPLLGQGWSLIHELYFYAVFAGFLVMARRRLPYALAGWAAAIGVVHLLAGAHLDTRPAWTIVTHQLTLEFIAGAFIALWFERSRPHRGGWAIFSLGAIALAVTAVVIAADAHEAIWHSPNTRVLVFGIPGALMVYGAVAAEIRSGSVLPRVMTAIGNASYSTYLSHGIVIGVCIKLWPTEPPLRGVPATITLAVIMVTASLIAGGISYRVLERPLLRATNRLLRRRRAAVA